MLKMLSFRCGSSAWTFPASHSLSFGRKSSATLINYESFVGGPIGHSRAKVESHESFHTLADSPSPMAQPKWSRRRFLPIKIPRHPWEQEFGAVAWRRSWSGKYFPFMILASKHSGEFIILQLSLASKASLKHWMSLNPKPPSRFDFVIVDHATHEIFLSSGFESHQNLVSADWILLHKDLGNL
ncbi:hypothetical protein YC2023_116146 [Brassica napus]